jgi:hypothetical protein
MSSNDDRPVIRLLDLPRRNALQIRGFKMTPKDVADILDNLRSDVGGAGAGSIQVIQSNIPAHFDNLRAYVQSTPEFEESFSAARQQCLKLLEMIADKGALLSQDDPIVREARESALGALDELEEKIDEAGPSPESKALGC